jgi:putative ABC transport system substrate-binding protein
VALDVSEVQAASRAIGLEVATWAIRRSEDIASAIETVQGKAEALYVAGDPLVTTNRSRIALLAVGARLPTIQPNHENVDAGGLISYGPNLPDLHRRAADLVDKILRGTKPSDIPVEQRL